MNVGQVIKTKVTNIYKFVRYDIWRITSSEISKTQRYVYNSIKTVLLAIRGFSEDNLQTRASALTYYTLFAIIPILALMLGIGRGFGFQDLIIQSIASQFTAPGEVMPFMLEFVDKYINNINKGVFIGIGIAALLWSVMSGFGQIETAFNDIWGVKKSRTFVVQFATYFSIMFIFPLFIVASSGLSVFISTRLSDNFLVGLFSPVLKNIILISPYFINWILFTALFIIVPNTRVRFMPALFAGIFTGTIFQIFQYLYIQGQVYLTSYNAVYGGFAIIPLLLLWLQTSWLIILLGAEISFAAQNISNFEFETDSQRISKRYKDFLTLSIMHIIVKQFENEEDPQTAEQISKENSIPIRLVTDIINQLLEVKLIHEVLIQNGKLKAYQPAIDIHKITVSSLFDKIEQEGSENFNIDKEKKFKSSWMKLERIKKDLREHEGATLIKDL